MSPHEVLGVPADADAESIKKAYRRLARKHHPDRNPGDFEAARRFQAVQDAYDALTGGKPPSDQLPPVISEILSAHFVGALQNLMKSGRSIHNVDFMAMIRSSLEDFRKQQKAAVESMAKLADALAGAEGRFTTEEGQDNLLDGLREHHLAGLRKEITRGEENLRHVEIALEVLGKHKFKFEPARTGFAAATTASTGYVTIRLG